MHALCGLCELHLIAHQYDVSRTQAHGDDIGNRYLPGFVDEEVIQRLIEFRPCEQPGGAGNQIIAAPADVLVGHDIVDHRTIQLMILRRAFLGPAEHDSPVECLFLDLDEEVIDGLMRIRRHPDALTLSQHIDDGVSR